MVMTVVLLAVTAPSVFFEQCSKDSQKMRECVSDSNLFRSELSWNTALSESRD